MTYGPYSAVVTKNVDGDTVWLALDLASRLPGNQDLGFGVTLNRPELPITLKCRVVGINAPELSTAAGKDAAAYAAGLLPVGSVVSVVSHGWDKYGGRFDGAIALPDRRDFATLMLESGHAVPFPA